jgi:hypothetical protein
MVAHAPQALRRSGGRSIFMERTRDLWGHHQARSRWWGLTDEVGGVKAVTRPTWQWSINGSGASVVFGGDGGLL